MERQIKVIWDFKGQTSMQTAMHHEIHLKEFIKIENLPIKITGFKSISEMHAIAFLVTTDSFLIQIRDSLKPNRAEIFNETKN